MYDQVPLLLAGGSGLPALCRPGQQLRVGTVCTGPVSSPSRHPTTPDGAETSWAWLHGCAFHSDDWNYAFSHQLCVLFTQFM